MRASVEMGVQQQDWEKAAIRASNVSKLELTLGEMAAALRDAERSLQFADRSGDAFQRMLRRATLANSRHQSGRGADALTLFRDAESMQAERQPGFPFLYSLRGFEYCDLLLGDAERMAWATTLAANPVATDRLKLEAPLDTLKKVEQRAAKMFEWRVSSDSLLTLALDRLTLGRVALYRAILERSSFEPTRKPLTAAVQGLRTAGSMHHLPRGFLSRAWLRFTEGNADGAKADLDDAWQIAERGAMKLHMADIHLHRARLIEETGYHRRDEELRDAQEAARHWPQQPDYPPASRSRLIGHVATLDAEC
ncbi:MAG: hypothetical protein ACREXX_18115 [Gammaproteobacteria bacterium]